MYKLSILYDNELLEYGVSKYVTWEPHKTAHAIIIGSTGSGKTYFSQLLLGRIVKDIPDSRLYICDYKGDEDFSFLSGSQRFYRYKDCQEGLDQFYNEFIQRQSGLDLERAERYLFFDEYASYLNSLDKKKAEEEKSKVSNLLMMARSFGLHVIISMQRGDSQYFQTARDNISLVVALGTLSDESASMFFGSYKKLLKPKGLGTGYVLMNGNKLKEIRVPTIRNKDKLKEAIRLGVTR